MRTSKLILAALLLTAACGGDDINARDYDGLWLIMSMTVNDNGSPLTVTRDGTSQAVRGDVLWTGTGDTAATMQARQTLLVDGLMAGPVYQTDLTGLVEADRWVLTDEGGEVTVFTLAQDGDHMDLTLDPTDPRMTAVDPPTAISLHRVTPWSSTSVGDWDLVSITVGGQTLAADTCIEVQTGLVWGKITMVISIDDRLVFTRTMTSTAYSDANCTVQANQQVSVQAGYGEEETDTTLRMWAYENGNAQFLEFSMAIAADVLTLTRTSCLPLPGCTDGTPTEVIVQRRP